MGKRRLLFFGVVAASIAAVAWEVFRPHEPMYDGKPLSFWLANYLPGNRTETSVQLSDHALHAVGTNAVPYLVSMLQESDSPLRLRLDDLLRKQHFFKYKRLNRFERTWEAMWGLMSLRGDARSATPALVQFLQSKSPVNVRSLAAATLGTIGPSASNAVPALLVVLANPSDGARFESIKAVGIIHSRSDIAIPVLVQSLDDTDYFQRVYAAESLAQFGADAKSAVPALLRMIQDSDGFVRYSCLRALKDIDSEAAAKAETELRASKN